MLLKSIVKWLPKSIAVILMSPEHSLGAALNSMCYRWLPSFIHVDGPHRWVNCGTATHPISPLSHNPLLSLLVLLPPPPPSTSCPSFNSTFHISKKLCDISLSKSGLLLPNISISTHLPKEKKTQSHSFCLNETPLCILCTHIMHNVYIQLSIDGHLGWLPTATVNRTMINLAMQMSLLDADFIPQILWCFDGEWPHWLICLKIWSPVHGTIWKSLGDEASLEVYH